MNLETDSGSTLVPFREGKKGDLRTSPTKAAESPTLKAPTPPTRCVCTGAPGTGLFELPIPVGPGGLENPLPYPAARFLRVSSVPGGVLLLLRGTSSGHDVPGVWLITLNGTVHSPPAVSYDEVSLHPES